MWLLKIRRLAREIGRETLVLLFAVRDPATPMALKAASVALLAYLVSPIDLVPDVPVIGWIDDLLVVSLGLPYLIRRLPPAVYLRASARADRLLASLGVEPAPKRATRGKTGTRGTKGTTGTRRGKASPASGTGRGRSPV